MAQRKFTLVPCAAAGDRFTDFMPYVASLNDAGVVAFQAALRRGGTGVFIGSGGPVATVIEAGSGPLGAITSHPDINRAGAVCFYAELTAGGQGVFLVRDGQLIAVARSGRAKREIPGPGF